MPKFIQKQAGGTYFYSSAIAGRKNLFVNEVYLDLMVKNIKSVAKDLKVKNLAYLIMPNHFYWLFQLPKEQDNPVAVYGELKKRISFEILDNLRDEAKNGDHPMLDLFAENEKVCRSNARKIIWFFKQQAINLKDAQGKQKKLKMWADDSRLWLIKSEEFLKKNLEYLKTCPLKERWQLVEKSEDYPYLYFEPKPCLQQA